MIHFSRQTSGLPNDVRMVSVTALSVLHVMCSMCLHLLVDGQVNVPPCTQLGSKRVGELCFNYYPTAVTWYQAKSNCEVNGTMTLAYVSSRQQIIEIVLEFAKVYYNQVQDIVWIGASDEKKEGEFIWVATNERATELENLWSIGEPNNIKPKDGSDEDCVGLYNQFYVNDMPCNRKFPYLCIENSLQKRSFPAWLIFLLIFIPLVLATGVTGFFVYKRKANRAKALQINNVPTSFEKSDYESIYHTAEEASVAMIRDSDDGHRYDLTIDEPDLEVFKSNLFKRESIAPLPPPRSSEKNKLGTICLDVSPYDVCGAHDIDHPYMKIDNSTSQNIASFKEEDNSIIENNFVLISGNKEDNNSLLTSIGNQNISTESAGINSFSNTFIEFKNNTNENISQLIAQNKHQYFSNDREFKTEDVKSVKTLKATDEYTHVSHCGVSSQELDSKNEDNSNKTMQENNKSQASDKQIDCTKNENSSSLTCDLADTEAYQGCYSSPLIRNDEHFYAPLSCVDSRIILMLKDQDHNAYDEKREEHTKNLIDKQKVACDFEKEIDEIEKSRIPNVELTVQAYNADKSMYIPPMLSNFVIEKGFAIRDDDSNEIKDVAVLKCSANGLAGDIISSNSTRVEDNEYITPSYSETYPMMFNGDEIGTEPEKNNKENWYLKLEGAQSEDDIQMKPGCENKEGYLTWDGGDVSCADDVPNNYIPIFASSGRQVVLDENSRKAEPAENQCVHNYKVCHSEIQEDVLVYKTPDGTKKLTFCVAKQLSPDEYSAPNDSLKLLFVV